MQQQQWVWAVVIVGTIVLFLMPVIIAAIRGTEPLWPVVVLTALTPLGGLWWFVAWFVALAAPRRPSAPPRRSAPPDLPALPAREDPKCLYGGVPPADTVVLTRSRDGAGSGVSVWS